MKEYQSRKSNGFGNSVSSFSTLSHSPVIPRRYNFSLRCMSGKREDRVRRGEREEEAGGG